MAVVRLEVFKALQAQIAAAVPEVSAHVTIGQQPGSKKLCIPSVNIYPTRLRYLPDQASEHLYDDGANTLVYNVGRHTGTVQLQLVASNPYQRMELGEKLTDLFLESTSRPGVLLTPVTAIAALGTFQAAFELEEDEWQDGSAFDGQFWATTVVTAVIPALVTEVGAVYTMDDLRLGLTHDMTTVFTSTTFDSSTAIERIRINEDGTFTRLA